MLFAFLAPPKTFKEDLKMFKKFLAVLLILLLSFSALAACGKEAAKEETTPEKKEEKKTETSTKEESPAPKEVAQEYLSIYSDEVTTMNYLTSATTNEFAVAANLVDTLIDYDKYGLVTPGLAQDWSTSEDGLTWTFHLRDTNWVDHKGKTYAPVVAQDFVDAMKYILDPTHESKTANIAYNVIENAQDYYDGKISDFSQVGIKATDEKTLVYTLKKPTPYFLSMLTYVCFFPANGKFLAEKGDLFGTSNENLLYNGAYILETFEPQSRRVLVKNESYWDKENIFIEKLKYKYNKEAATLGPELYLRGEISSVSIPASSIDEWMKDASKKEMVRPSTTNFYTYFYALNFKPEFEAQYEPENWKIVVNNTNFRKSIFHAIDRKAAMLTSEPYNPEGRISNTITPKNFVAIKGLDYSQIDALGDISKVNSFNSDQALRYKEKALEELKGKATFPVKIPMPYNTGGTEATNRAQVLEQQLEKLLGADYVDILILPFPPTGYLNATRRAGNYGLMECNWGPDYADPETYSDPFARDSNYNFPEFCQEKDADGNNLYENYEKTLTQAKNEVLDLNKRYALFAKAESYLIQNAFVIPYAVGGGGYVSSKINPFESQYSPFGVSAERWKGQKILEKPLSTEEFLKLQEKWQEERLAALAKASK